MADSAIELMFEGSLDRLAQRCGQLSAKSQKRKGQKKEGQTRESKRRKKM